MAKFLINLLLCLTLFTKKERKDYFRKREEERRVKMMIKRYRNFW